MRYFLPIIFTITMLPYFAYSFCVYNQHTDGTSFYITEVDGYGHSSNKAFKKERIHAGEKQCCHYSNQDCVIGGNPNAILRFYVHRFASDKQSIDAFEITCPGGGSLTLGGTSGSPATSVKWADGSDFPYAKNTNVRRVWAAKVNGTRTDNDQEHVLGNGRMQNETEEEA